MNCQLVSLSSFPQEQTETQYSQPPTRAVEKWMFVCQRNADLQPNIESEQEVDWTRAAQAHANIPSTTAIHLPSTTATHLTSSYPPFSPPWLPTSFLFPSLCSFCYLSQSLHYWPSVPVPVPVYLYIFSVSFCLSMSWPLSMYLCPC